MTNNTNDIRHKIRLNKGDKVIVRAGKYKGKTGVISAVHYNDNTVTVEGINVVKRHQKANRENPQGAVIELTKPMPVFKVALIEPKTSKPTKIKYGFDKDGNKKRISKSTGQEIKG
jgi:large subunit ribosomal protein L24